MESRKREMLQDKGALHKEDGDVTKEYKSMHEENFLSSWLRKDEEDKKERTMEVDRETKEEMGKKWIRDEEKGENETVIVERRCVNPVSTEAFDISSQGEDWRVVVFLW